MADRHEKIEKCLVVLVGVGKYFASRKAHEYFLKEKDPVIMLTVRRQHITRVFVC